LESLLIEGGIMKKAMCILAICSLITSLAYGSVLDIRINEVMPINDSVNMDSYGEYDDWIEIINTGTLDVNLRDCFFTDDLNNISKWQISDTDIIIPPNQYYVLWLDGDTVQGKDHLPFNLKGLGETLGLFSPSFQIIDYIIVPQSRADISYGRKPDGDGPWVWFTEPTPGASNSTNSYLGFTPEPIFNYLGGSYQSAFSCEISPQALSDRIYYTSDSHDPDSSSLLYSAPLFIDHTKVIRAVAIKDGFLPSNIVSQFYLFNNSYSLPVWATITDPDNLYGTNGIYSHPWNAGFAWERFAQHQYIKNNNLEFSINSGIRIQGGNSVGMAKKSFRQFYNSRYGFDELRYPLFSHIPLNSFHKLVFRAGYDDDITTSVGTLLRDPLSSEVYRSIGELISNSEWTVLFLDTTFWGIYNIKESVDERFVMDHTGLEQFDLIRYQKNTAELKYGTIDSWNAMDLFIKTSDFTIDSNYYNACEIINMESLLNLLAFVHATQYRSWTWGCFVFKGYDVGDKWNWTIWDTDRSYEELNWNGFTEYAITANEKWPNILPQKLLHSPIFKNQLINRTADFLNYYFIPDTIIGVLDSLVSIIEPDIQAEKNRWNTNAAWDAHVENIRNFLIERPSVVRNQILSYFSLPNTATVNLNIEGKGRILLNSLNLSQFPWSGIYFETVPVTVKAVPSPGYKFAGWDFTGSMDPLQTIDLNSDINITAYFEIDASVTDTGIVIINEIMYNTGPDDFSDDWIELYNPGNTKDLSLWTIKDDDDMHVYTIPEGTLLYPDNYLVIAKNYFSFAIQHPTTTNSIGSFGSGITGFSLGNSGDIIRLFDKRGILVDSVNFGDSFPWTNAADGNGPSLQLINADSDNSLAENWSASWINKNTPGYKNFTGFTLINGVIAEQPLDAVLYPNPTTDRLWLSLNLNESTYIDVELYDLLGRNCGQLYQGFVPAGRQTIELNLLEIIKAGNNAIYFVRISDKKQYVNLKLIIN
jgi:hypothetical protein